VDWPRPIKIERPPTELSGAAGWWSLQWRLGEPFTEKPNPALAPRREAWSDSTTGRPICVIFANVTERSPHPYRLKVRPCEARVGRHRWEILDDDGLLQTSATSFETEREAKENGCLEMQGLIEMWNKR
jgi:hypothetical protein